ncbi:hypothetical protein [Rummeliibacillus stabekisii]|uniref:hypothetical protein n=1 Tax=Rummeliibacillus stabekisii TaxID=241244 RepID=UPI00371573A8
MNQIRELLQYNKMESKVFMPNEIFEDLQKSKINSVHIPVAYSYYYLINYLYRNTKYYDIPIDNKGIKEILEYHRNQQSIDYIIKKGGILDQIGYTETVKDFPVMWEFDEYEGLRFTMFSDMDEFTQSKVKQRLSRKYTIKYPIKAIERVIQGEMDNGTFSDAYNTHIIPFEVFMFCMENDKLCCTAFYLYSFLKMMNDRFTDGWGVPIVRMAIETGIPKTTLEHYLDQLNLHRMIETKHNQEFFCLALEERKANTYISNNHEQFSLKELPYKKMKVMKTSEYYAKMENECEELFGGSRKADVPLDMLPF